VSIGMGVLSVLDEGKEYVLVCDLQMCLNYLVGFCRISLVGCLGNICQTSEFYYVE